MYLLHAVETLTSGKSTQNAFIFNPYKKLAKFSLNLAKLSCINCKCMKLASKSAIESDNSAKAGSKDSRGASDAPPRLTFPDSRSDDLEDGRKGVVGRDIGLRLRLPDVDRFALLPTCGVVEDDMINGGFDRYFELSGKLFLLSDIRVLVEQ